MPHTPVPTSPAANQAEPVWEQRASAAVEAAHSLVHEDPGAAEALVRPVLDARDTTVASDVAGRAQHVLGLARAYQGDPVGAASYLTAAIDTLAGARARRFEGVARCDLASIHGHHLGLTTEATAGFEHALTIAVEVGSRQDEGRALSLMGGLYGRIGQLAESERTLRRAIELLDEKLDPQSHMSACNNLGYLLCESGRHAEAVPILAHELARLDLANSSMACTLRCSLALALAHSGDPDRAMQLLGDNRAQLADLGAYDRVDHGLTLARVHLVGGRPAEALPLLRQALADAEQAELHAPAAECLRELAQAAEHVGDLRTALDAERRLRQAERSLIDSSNATALQAREDALQVRALAAEKRVAERSLALLRSVVDADDDLIFAKDEHGLFVLANRAFLNYWNLQASDVLGRTSREVFGSTPMIEASLAADAAVRSTGLPQQIEQTVLTLRGERTMLTRRMAIESPDGAPWLLGVARDVTEMRRQDEALRRQQAFTREVIDQDTNHIFVKDAALRYVMVNTAFARLFGKRPDQLIGCSPLDLSDNPQELAPILAADRQVLADGREIEQEDSFTVAGEMRRFLATKRPIRMPDGATGILGIARDMTEIRRAEQSLREALQAAEAANHAKSSFLANMSHEVRTPINGIMGMVDLAARTESAHDRGKYLDLARSSADALLAIVNDVLDFSKVEAGMMTVEQVPFSVYALVNDLMRPLALKTAEKKLSLCAGVAEDLPLTLVGDPTRLRQVLTNLLGNAIKFTERGAVTLEVRVLSVQAKKVQMRFAVHDTGIGIAPDQQARVFAAFTQADGSITRRFGGTGLGLAISARLVSLMGGQLALTSQPGAGSCFSFALTLPLEPSASATARLRPPAAMDASVAWIEPLVEQRAWFTQMLQRWQVEVHAFASVSEAQQLSPAANVGAVFLGHDVLAAEGDAVVRLLQDHPGARLFAPVGAEAALPPVVVAALGPRALALPSPLLPADLIAALNGLHEPPPLASSGSAAPPTDVLARPFEGLRVLLAEDNPVNQLLAVAVVERLGADLYNVDDGAEALVLMQQMGFDLVLMDVQMPVLDGSEAVTRWRALEAQAVAPRRLPIVAMTAHALLGDRERFLVAGFDGYISKPFKEADLVSEVLRVLTASRGNPT